MLTSLVFRGGRFGSWKTGPPVAPQAVSSCLPLVCPLRPSLLMLLGTELPEHCHCHFCC